MNIVFTQTAHRDIQSIYHYILKRDAKETAKENLEVIENMIDSLSEYSQLGKIGRIKNTRELTVPRLPYVIVYQIHKDYIAIVTIMHTARKWG